ncbi:AraC-like DNA-binding protein [Inhella inkyongensis]|uniref:AraC-like DNA-binding protein n=1 Tax=Inhella inkyongensis TaxID=392593 RepID=A0A840S5F1_9BURK|nr:AraC family transcriptional regulator [Inhella inkyongensis]MBB5204802.1 AraC-like DNA-binding protein [Inhella inkyongensis]
MLNDDGAYLWLPPLDLAGCTRGAMLRDTTGLPVQPRRSYFPASAMASLVWFFEGETWTQPLPGFASEREECAPPIILAGPYTLPLCSRQPRPIRVLQLLLQPDALHSLTGLNPGELVNTSVDARSALPGDWADWAQAVLDLGDPWAALPAIEAFLRPRWQAVGADRPAVRRYADWMEALALRAAETAGGKSLRQFERRIKSWAGLPMRELRGLARAEAAFHLGAAGVNSLAEQAVDAGYADQSHLTRETRRITGFPPAELAQRIRADEAFWLYRLWM